MMQAKKKTRPLRETISGNVLMLGLVSFFTDLSSEMIYPLLPVFLTGLVSAQAAAVYIGLMDGIAESVSSLLKIYSGGLSDRLGKRKAIAAAGYGISTVSRPLMGLALAGWHVIALRFFDRVGKGVRTSARDALIGDCTEESERGVAFSFHRMMDHAGAVGGPLMAAAVLYAVLGYGLWEFRPEAVAPEEMHALRVLFAASLVPGLLAMSAILFRVKDVRPSNGGGDELLPSGKENAGRLPMRFYHYLAAVTVFTLGNSSDLFLVFYARTRFELGLGQTLALWAGLHVSKIIFSLPGGALSDRYGRKAVILSGWVVYFAVYAGMAFVSNLAVFSGLIFLYGVYYGLTEGAERAFVADFVPCEQRGKAYGLFHGAVGLAALPASLVFGVFWMKLGPVVAFSIGAALAAAASMILAAMPSRD